MRALEAHHAVRTHMTVATHETRVELGRLHRLQKRLAFNLMRVKAAEASCVALRDSAECAVGAAAQAASDALLALQRHRMVLQRDPAVFVRTRRSLQRAFQHLQDMVMPPGIEGSMMGVLHCLPHSATSPVLPVHPPAPEAQHLMGGASSGPVSSIAPPVPPLSGISDAQVPSEAMHAWESRTGVISFLASPGSPLEFQNSFQTRIASPIAFQTPHKTPIVTVDLLAGEK